MICGSRYCVLAALFFHLSAARAADLDRVLAVLDAIKERHDGYNPVDIRYRLKTTYTKYGFAASQRIDPRDRRLWDRLQDATVTFQCQYAVKGDRLRIVGEGPAVSAEGGIGPITRGVSAYDGTLFRTTGDGKVVSVSRKKPSHMEEPLTSFTGEGTLLRLRITLKAGAKPDALTLTEKPDRVPGAALYFRLVFGKGEEESSSDVWVSPADKGSCVLRFEPRLGGKLFHAYSDCEYKPVDGVWFPSKAVYRNYYNKGNIHQIATEKRLEVERITCRADEIPDSQFVIPVANDSELIDRDRKDLRIVGPDEVEKHIREAADDVARQRAGGGWRPWVYLSVSVLLLLGAVYLGVRIIRARWRPGKTIG